MAPSLTPPPAPAARGPACDAPPERPGGAPGGAVGDDEPTAASAARTPVGCRPTEAHADAYVDGELPAGAVAAIDAHLRGCAACRAHVAALRRLVAAVRRQGAADPPAPASLRARALEIAARWHRADDPRG